MAPAVKPFLTMDIVSVPEPAAAALALLAIGALFAYRTRQFE